MASGQRDPKQERFWLETLRRHRGSGPTVRAFCESERLAETAFHAWRRHRHGLDPQRHLTSVLATVGRTPVSELGQFLPDAWKAEDARQPAG
jgi:hypothetical protein